LRKGGEWFPIINGNPANASQLLLRDQKILFPQFFSKRITGFFESDIAIWLRIHLEKLETPR